MREHRIFEVKRDVIMHKTSDICLSMISDLNICYSLINQNKNIAVDNIQKFTQKLSAISNLIAYCILPNDLKCLIKMEILLTMF